MNDFARRVLLLKARRLGDATTEVSGSVPVFCDKADFVKAEGQHAVPAETPGRLAKTPNARQG